VTTSHPPLLTARDDDFPGRGVLTQKYMRTNLHTPRTKHSAYTRRIHLGIVTEKEISQPGNLLNYRTLVLNGWVYVAVAFATRPPPANDYLLIPLQGPNIVG